MEVRHSRIVDHPQHCILPKDFMLELHNTFDVFVVLLFWVFLDLFLSNCVVSEVILRILTLLPIVSIVNIFTHSLLIVSLVLSLLITIVPWQRILLRFSCLVLMMSKNTYPKAYRLLLFFNLNLLSLNVKQHFKTISQITLVVNNSVSVPCSK
jgi:hypothetical protein